MKIAKRNVKKLASLSALGAGALGVSAGAAEASSIVFSGTVDAAVGFGPGDQRSVTFAPYHAAAGELRAVRSIDTFFFGSGGELRGKGSFGTRFAFAGGADGLASAFPRGARFGTPARLRTLGFVFYTSNGSLYTNFDAKDDYLLFKFTGGGLPHDIYGWAQLEIGVTNFFLEATLVDWAYDTSGAQIPAGYTGTPEPSSFVLTGLSALALGAVGLRNWRAQRRS